MLKRARTEESSVARVREDSHDEKIADTRQESEATYLEQAKKKNSHQRLILSRFRRIPNGGTCLPQRFPKDGSTKLLVIPSIRRASGYHQCHGGSS